MRFVSFHKFFTSCGNGWWRRCVCLIWLFLLLQSRVPTRRVQVAVERTSLAWIHLDCDREMVTFTACGPFRLEIREVAKTAPLLRDDGGSGTRWTERYNDCTRSERFFLCASSMLLVGVLLASRRFIGVRALLLCLVAVLPVGWLYSSHNNPNIQST